MTFTFDECSEVSFKNKHPTLYPITILQFRFEAYKELENDENIIDILWALRFFFDFKIREAGQSIILHVDEKDVFTKCLYTLPFEDALNNPLKMIEVKTHKFYSDKVLNPRINEYTKIFLWNGCDKLIAKKIEKCIDTDLSFLVINTFTEMIYEKDHFLDFI